MMMMMTNLWRPIFRNANIIGCNSFHTSILMKQHLV